MYSNKTANTMPNTMNPRDETTRYTDQPAWQDIQAFLPRERHLTPETTPVERFWDWRGHRIHLDRLERKDSPVRIILFHGVGSNGRQMSMTIGAPLFQLGYDVAAIDMPPYGLTRAAPRARITYEDWVALAVDFIRAGSAGDDRPFFLYGLSAGGMLTYHVAARMASEETAGAGRIIGIGGTTFLDQRERMVRDRSARNLFMSRIGTPFAHLVARTPLAGLKLPMRLVSKMHRLVNDPDALRILLKDKTSAGSWASMAFLSSYLRYRPTREPEAFDACPILLTQPGADNWTPLVLSEVFLARVRQAPVKVVMLNGASHYPMEEEALARLTEAVDGFIRKRMPPVSGKWYQK
uniref:Lysophospholipase, alpha-beta hydrolase superfamily n=1 Tax=Candidatus Kentrum sp. DK TaxID=2126562 RepID=A0A450SG15_9GAMM|nr:MAG: Lysophospholipase, alpha-beta hydrolase superfamily [Candidatus Kentron sp. DK]